jgi:hypothetical protein
VFDLAFRLALLPATGLLALRKLCSEVRKAWDEFNEGGPGWRW